MSVVRSKKQKETIEWPEKLIESIARRRSVIFLGAGISANSTNEHGSHPKTWKEFLEHVMNVSVNKNKIKEQVSKLLREKKFLLACEMIVGTIGDSAFNEEVKNEYRRAGYSPAKIHEVIFGLDSRIVITVNVDQIYDNYVRSVSNSTVVVKQYYEEDLAHYLRSSDYLLIKAHGTVDDTPNKLIFTHAQYSKARCEHASFYQIIDSLILTHTFIFLGCGIDDPDISLLLENANFHYKDCPPHYFVTEEESSADQIKQILSANRNLEVITYKNQSCNHEELLDGIKKLSRLVEEKRGELASNTSW